MAFPSRTGVATSSITTAGTSLAVNFLSNPAAGQLLIILVRHAGAPGTITFTGYTVFAGPDTSDASDDSTALYYRWADGTEGASDTISWVNSVKTCAISYQVIDAENPATQAPQASTVAVGTGANANSTIVTPTGGAKDYFFLLALGMDSETATASRPSGYTADFGPATTGTGGAVATNCMVWMAEQQLNASSEDPAAWTSSAPNAGWTAWTVAVHPPAAAGPDTLNTNFMRKRRGKVRQGVHVA